MIRPLSAPLIGGLAVMPVPAFAHAHLVHAKPAAGATVPASPDAVDIEFSEGVVPRLSGIIVADAAGKPVTADKPAGHGTSLSVAIRGKLTPGTYTVTWHAVSVDSHRTQGHFKFTVAP